MSFKRGLGIVLFIVGVVLLTLGIKATDKVSEGVVKAVEGHYTNTTMWYLIGGGALIVIGGCLTIGRRR